MLRNISNDALEETVTEIMYGQSQSKRSDKCFVFMLEDRTSGEEIFVDRDMEEKGLSTDKMYGVCVIHSRLITQRCEGTGAEIQFEADVCYAFVTRFPFFDFFFQTLWDILSVERLARMELQATHCTDDPHYDRHSYVYIPSELLRSSLATLATCKPPKFGEKLSVEICNQIATREWTRLIPYTSNIEERHMMYAQWALPVMFEWLPPKIIIWTLSLLLCEAKLLVVGSETGIVTSTIMGLMTLMHPLKWVAPFIPLLPVKHIDFIESPVPIVAGITNRRSVDGILGI